MKAPLPDNEAARIETLRQYEILDTEPDESFNDLARLAAYICGIMRTVRTTTGVLLVCASDEI